MPPPLTRTARRIALAALAALTSGAAAPDAAPAATCPDWLRDPGRLERMEDRLVALVNARRARIGREALVRDPRLDAVARAHARAMAVRRELRHLAPDGSGVEERLRAAGVQDWSETGENIGRISTVKYRATDQAGRYPSAGCQDAASAAVELEAGWSLSLGHRGNMLSRDYTHVGSGAGYDPRGEDVYVAHVFVRRVDCGFPGGPCCVVAERPGLRSCQSPLTCGAGVCRP